jgi:phosphoserine phosphatase
MSQSESVSQRVHITVAGPDTPGITAALTAVIAENKARLIDIEQVVVRGQLTLCLLLAIDVDQEDPVLKDLLFTATKMGLEMRFQPMNGSETVRETSDYRFALTAIGDGCDAHGLSIVSGVLADHKANIEKIQQLSRGGLGSVEIVGRLVSSEAEDAEALRRALILATRDEDMDIALQREGLLRRSKRLVVMDMDSTLIQIEVIDELARAHGVVDRVSDITRRAMAGELDYEQSLRERVRLLEGMSYEDVLKVVSDLPVTDGARSMLRVLQALGYKTAVISGGFLVAANALKEELGLSYAYANALVVADGRLTGTVDEPVVTPQRKADLLDAIAQREGISLEQTIAIGDGANDMAMLMRAGLGIAFHAKAKLRAAADTSLSAGGLDRILFLLGFHARDVHELLDGMAGRE